MNDRLRAGCLSFIPSHVTVVVASNVLQFVKKQIKILAENGVKFQPGKLCWWSYMYNLIFIHQSVKLMLSVIQSRSKTWRSSPSSTLLRGWSRLAACSSGTFSNLGFRWLKLIKYFLDSSNFSFDFEVRNLFFDYFLLKKIHICDVIHEWPLANSCRFFQSEVSQRKDLMMRRSQDKYGQIIRELFLELLITVKLSIVSVKNLLKDSTVHILKEITGRSINIKIFKKLNQIR